MPTLWFLKLKSLYLEENESCTVQVIFYVYLIKGQHSTEVESRFSPRNPGFESRHSRNISDKEFCLVEKRDKVMKLFRVTFDGPDTKSDRYHREHYLRRAFPGQYVFTNTIERSCFLLNDATSTTSVSRIEV